MNAIPRSGPPRPAISIDDFTYVQQLLLERAGILLESGKQYLAETRLSSLAELEGLASIAELVQRANEEGEWGPLQRKVIETMTITETSFFRDLPVFEALHQHIIPTLLAARANERRLRIWCGAAASGQEPYSVALLLRDRFPQLASWKVTLLASDISGAMLARARAGVFTQIEINRGLPARLLVKHFRKQGDEWHLADDVRRGVDFQRINLTGPWPVLPAFDLVLLRNVLMYFGVETKKAVLERVSRMLRPDGVLFLGSGETPLQIVDHFVPHYFGKAIAYRLAAATRRG